MFTAVQPPEQLTVQVLSIHMPAVKDAVSNLTMPSFGWRLDDQQVADVVNFIRTSWGNNAPAISASDVAKVRKETAAHDEKALGNADISKLPGAGQ